MKLKCMKCNKEMSENLNTDVEILGILICSDCAKEIGLTICCGKPMHIDNSIILSKCNECDNYVRGIPS